MAERVVGRGMTGLTNGSIFPVPSAPLLPGNNRGPKFAAVYKEHFPLLEKRD